MSQPDPHFNHAMRIVSQALQLDSTQRNKEAFTRYLEGVLFIGQTLLHESQKNEFSIGNTSQKLIKLGQQCMERLGAIVDGVMQPSSDGLSRVGSTAITPTSESRTICPATNQSDKRMRSHSVPDKNPPTSPVTRTGHQEYSSRTASVTSDPPPRPPSTLGLESPMDVAQRQNRQLMAAYKQRLQRADKYQSSSIGLALQRQLAENIAIAKAREASFQKKVQFRQQRIEMETAKRFSSMMGGMTKDEQERRDMYRKILEYEQTTQWPIPWKQKLKENPKDTSLIQKLLKTILSVSDHPLTEKLHAFQTRLAHKVYPLVSPYLHELKPIRVPFDEEIHRDSSTVHTSHECSPLNSDSSSLLSPQSSEHSNQAVDLEDELGSYIDSDEVGEDEGEKAEEVVQKDDLDPEKKIVQLTSEAFVRHIKNIVQDVHGYLDKLMTMFVLAYEELDNVTGRDVCYSCIEEPFFKPVWPYLLALFRLANKEREIAIAKVMTQYQNATPEDFGINPEFLPDPLAPSKDRFPYEPAVIELHKIFKEVCPLNKLEVPVRLSRLVCQCAEEYCPASRPENSQSPNIGADDLLPILCFVIARSGLPELVSECHALEEFIYEGYLLGEEGYCLTSMQTALGYVETLISDTDT